MAARSNFPAIGGAVILIVLLAGIVGCNPLSDEITYYPAVKVPGKGYVRWPRTVFKVNTSNQMIVYWRPGVNEAPKRLLKCAIRDKNNWTAQYENAWPFSGKIEVIDGEINDPSQGAENVGLMAWYGAREDK